MYLGLSIILTSFVLPTILRLIGLFPENDSSLLLPFLIVSQITTGFGMAIMVVGMGSIMADIADDQELKTGKRQEGLIFSFIGKIFSFNRYSYFSHVSHICPEVFVYFSMSFHCSPHVEFREQGHMLLLDRSRDFRT